MEVPWPIPGGRLGMLKLPPEESAYVRGLKRRIDMKYNAVTYLSFMVKSIPTLKSNTGAAVAGSSEGGGEGGGSLQDSGFPGGSLGTRSARVSLRLILASSSNGGDAIAIGYRNQFFPFRVAKIVSRKNGEAEVYLRVYSQTDSLDYAEPAVWYVVSRDLKLDARLDRVILRASGDRSQSIDELRIGPTWRSVAPIRQNTEVTL